MEPSEIAKDTEVEAGLVPILDGLHKMSDEIVRTRKTSDDRTSALEKSLGAKIETLEDKTNKSLEDVVSRIGKLKDFSGTLGKALLQIGPGDNALLDVIPKGIKDQGWAYEGTAASIKRRYPDSALGDPTVSMAVAAWFARSTRSQLLRHFSSTMREDAEARDKLYAALQEKHFGPNWETITKTSLSEGTGGTGAFGGSLVPTIVEATLVRQIKDAGKLFPLARQIQMTSLTHAVPTEKTAVTVNWVAEAGTLTPGEPTFSQSTLVAKKLVGRATMSVEVVEDSNIGLLAYLLEVFAEKMAGEIDKQMVCGDGSSPAITGIDNTAGITVISSSATTAGRNLSWQLLVNTYVGNGEGTAIENGYWIVTPKGYSQIMALVDTTGQPIIRFADTEQAPAGTLIGRPILLSARFGGAPGTVTATLDDSTNANTKIIYGVPSSVLFGTRMGMRWDVTDQVNWSNFQMDARLCGRFSSVVGVPANFARLSKVNYV